MSKLSIILSFVVIIVSSCNKASESSMEASSVDSVAVDMVSSSAASDNENTGDRKFIRTADMKFRVKNVLESTYHIENVAQKMGGFVTYTQLETANSYTNTKKMA